MYDVEENYLDPFDPETQYRLDEMAKEEEEHAPAPAREMLEARKRAYANVFTAGERSQADIDFVLNDLMWFCKVWVPSYDIRDGQHAEELSKRKEGRREVFSRIRNFARLDSDTLMLMYTDAITK